MTKKVTKVEQYIKDAVKASADEIKTKGVEVSNCSVDAATHVHVDNGDMTEVLLNLAKAQIAIAEAVVKVSKSKPDIENNSTGFYFEGTDRAQVWSDETNYEGEENES